MPDSSLARKHKQYKERRKCNFVWYVVKTDKAHLCIKIRSHIGNHVCNCGSTKRVKK